MDTNKMRNMGIIALVVIVGLVVLYALLKPFVILRPGERGVIENRMTGIDKRILKPGINPLFPIIQQPYVYNVKNQTYTIASIQGEGAKYGNDAIEVLTSDGQPAWIDISFIFRLDPEKIVEFHVEYEGRDYVDKVLRPTLRSTIRNIISKYSVVELYSSDPKDIAKALNVDVKELEGQKVGRLAISEDIFEKLKSELGAKYIIADSLYIRNVKFSDEYKQAIERKQIAQQEAEKMNYVIEKSKKEKEQKIIDAEALKESRIIQAEGEAESIQKIGQMLRANPRVIDYEYVQKISPNIKAIITDNKAIVNVSELLKD